MASLGNPAKESTAASHIPQQAVCDTGEPLPLKLVQSLREMSFVQLHWFLPAPLLQATFPTEECPHSHCHCAPNSTSKRSMKTVDDIFTWVLCFNRYIAALCSFHPMMLPQMTAYANTILQAYLQFQGNGWRVYDRAFRIEAASRKNTNWKAVDPSLYARFVACQSRRTSTCQFCCSSSHKSSACPWGVDEPSQQNGPTTTPWPPVHSISVGNRSTSPICLLWNGGACRFPESCRYRHACAICLTTGHRSIECQRISFRQRGPLALLPPPNKRAAP